MNKFLGYLNSKEPSLTCHMGSNRMWLLISPSANLHLHLQLYLPIRRRKFPPLKAGSSVRTCASSPFKELHSTSYHLHSTFSMAKSPSNYSQKQRNTSTFIQCPKWFLLSYSPVWHTLWKDWPAFAIWHFFLFHFQPTTNVFLWPFKKSNQSHYLSKYKGQLSSLFTMCLHSAWHLNILLSEMLLYKIPLTCLLRNHSVTYVVSIGVLVRFHSLLKRALVLPLLNTRFT